MKHVSTSQSDMPKAFDPQAVEAGWYARWEADALFVADPTSDKPKFTMCFPPPNITGELHMGHALQTAIYDLIARFRRMNGQEVLFLPGYDHAAIATQNVIEKQLAREGTTKEELGRERFAARVEAWYEQVGATIINQLRLLGASMDWTRLRFTMDSQYVRSVMTAFVAFYERDWIYRAPRIVNWCPHDRSAISDLEIEWEEHQDTLYFIRYPVEGGGEVVIATVRPETMLADTGVAVNPDDDRYRHLVGKTAVLPLVGRKLPIVADDAVEKDFGTGALKVTPGHDPMDYEIGQRHGLEIINGMHEDGSMQVPGLPYDGLPALEARKRVVDDLKAQELLVKEEPYSHEVGHCDRCHTVIEPLISEQWWLQMDEMRDQALAASDAGKVRWHPERYERTYLDWLRGLRDWNIGRQLWLGHRVPVYHCDNGHVVVSVDPPGECPECGSKNLTQDPDVLDTWFSSALWPFATLGWPDETEDLRRFYPNDLMIMGFDILFFWGARMIMMGLKFMHDVPFRELYIHALVRDAERQKMSKTKGNVLDPLEVTEKYGTDAVRFALAISASPGTDIAFSDDKVKSYRNFANKIWNAGRFILINLERLPEPARNQLGPALQPIPGLGLDRVAAPERLALADRWIFSRLLAVTREITDALASYRFHEAAHTVYHFFWHEFCDWYLEWVKPEITAALEGSKAAAAWVNLTRVFEAALHLLHPFMPFITEELWHQLPRAGRDPSLSLTSFSLVSERVADPISEECFMAVRELIVAARDAKADMGLQTQKPD